MKTSLTKNSIFKKWYIEEFSRFLINCEKCNHNLANHFKAHDSCGISSCSCNKFSPKDNLLKLLKQRALIKQLKEVS